MNLISRTFVKDAWSFLGWKWPILALLTFASAIFEGATVAALLPLLSSFNAGSSGATDRISRIFSSVLDVFGLAATPQTIAILIVVLITCSAAIFLSQSYLAARLHAFYVASWQRRMFSAFLAADYDFFVSRRSGDLVAAVTTEPARIGLVFSQLNVSVAAVLFILVQIVISIFIAPLVVVLMLGFGGVLFALTRRWAKRAMDFGGDLTRVNADLTADIGEIVGGAKFIKATATEHRATARLSGAAERMEFLSFGNVFDTQVVRAIFEYSGGLVIVALLLAGPVFLNVDVSMILVIVAIFVRLFPRVTGLRQSMQIADFHVPAFNEAMRLVHEAEMQREVVTNEAPPGWPGTAPASISIEHVYVEFGSRVVLQDLNLAIPAGAFVALTGHTGSGKTTLLDCILGLRMPTSGKVRVDGYDLSSLPGRHWRQGIGYLGQDPMLFNASIRENLSWIRPQTTEADMRAALDAAAADFVMRLPNGLDTIVGDHGGRLSGGERQRIALARALLGAPRLLVLDEATSSLDAETEDTVTKALSKLRGRITIVAISHRPALVQQADVVINMCEGRAEKVEGALAGSVVG